MTAEPTHIPVLVGTNPVTYIWYPICKCHLHQYLSSGGTYCPLHGYGTIEYERWENV